MINVLYTTGPLKAQLPHQFPWYVKILIKNINIYNTLEQLKSYYQTISYQNMVQFMTNIWKPSKY